jgi:hypothetical protein
MDGGAVSSPGVMSGSVCTLFSLRACVCRRPVAALFAACCLAALTTVYPSPDLMVCFDFVSQREND